jgi:hypothetical protein
VFAVIPAKAGTTAAISRLDDLGLSTLTYLLRSAVSSNLDSIASVAFPAGLHIFRVLVGLNVNQAMKRVFLYKFRAQANPM